MFHMRHLIPIAFGSLLLVAFVLLVAYYFMLRPFQPSLEVDDPVTAEWLRQDGVVIYRRGEELADSRMYLIEGERFGNGCSWHAGSSGSDDYVVVSRQIAMNHTTCESLIEEGKLIE